MGADILDDAQESTEQADILGALVFTLGLGATGASDEHRPRSGRGSSGRSHGEGEDSNDVGELHVGGGIVLGCENHGWVGKRLVGLEYKMLA